MPNFGGKVICPAAEPKGNPFPNSNAGPEVNTREKIKKE